MPFGQETVSFSSYSGGTSMKKGKVLLVALLITIMVLTTVAAAWFPKPFSGWVAKDPADDSDMYFWLRKKPSPTVKFYDERAVYCGGDPVIGFGQGKFYKKTFRIEADFTLWCMNPTRYFGSWHFGANYLKTPWTEESPQDQYYLVDDSGVPWMRSRIPWK
jgi:hypothetical protein